VAPGARQLAGGPPDRWRGRRAEPRIGDVLPDRQRGQVLNPHVNANRQLLVDVSLGSRHLDLERHAPALSSFVTTHARMQASIGNGRWTCTFSRPGMPLNKSFDPISRTPENSENPNEHQRFMPLKRGKPARPFFALSRSKNAA
jgi:hypothetical protein